jgi:tetratricopeptide (TPR) repeat protein
VRIGDLDAALRRTETISKTAGVTKVLLARAADVVALVAQRDALLVSWKAPPKHGAARLVSRYVAAERGLTERWPREQVERLIESEAFVPMLAVRGWLALEKGELRKALADAEAVLKKHPDDVRALLVRGRVRLEQSNAKVALKDLTRAVEVTKHQDAIALHWLAAGLLDAGRSKEALAKQRLAVLLRPDDAELRAQLRRLAPESKLRVTLSLAKDGVSINAVFRNGSDRGVKLDRQALESNVLTLEVRDASGKVVPPVPPPVPVANPASVTIAAGKEVMMTYRLDCFDPPLKAGEYRVRVRLPDWSSNELVHKIQQGK